ncbi:MAG: GNAT family N-acetyltransferase [Dehalococcoidia bacterium]
MRISITPFDRQRHLEAACELLGERHRRDRARQPFLPAAFEKAEACRPQIESAFENAGWYGVAAEADGRMAGYAIMTTQLIAPTHFLASFFPPRGASLPFAAHATREGMEYDVYREMYAALADHFVRKGFFDHSVNVPATDVAAREAFSSLGFGRTMCCAVRDVSPVGRGAAKVELHAAGGEDAEVIFGLNEELIIHHARSPIFNPWVRESDAGSHEFQRNLLNDAATNAHWVAYEDGRAIGMNTFMAPFFLSALTVPDKRAVYLFQGVVSEQARAGGVGSALLEKGVEWAREQGYEHIALHFATPNVSGAKFWQSSGFEPVEYGMRRRIDERIAWSGEEQ